LDKESEGKKVLSHRVVVSMDIFENEAMVERKQIDFGRMDKDALKELVDLFSLMAKDIEQVKKFGPQYRKLEKKKPEYVK